MAGRQQVGYLTEDMIGLLGAGFTPGRIFLGESNEAHMQSAHARDYAKYRPFLEQILATPDYIARHPGLGSIEFIKLIDDYVLVAVRVSASGVLYARSLYSISQQKFDEYCRAGTVWKFARTEHRIVASE